MEDRKLGKNWWLLGMAGLLIFLSSSGLITDYIIPNAWSNYSSVINGLLGVIAFILGIIGVYFQVNVKVEVPPAESKSEMLEPTTKITDNEGVKDE